MARTITTDWLDAGLRLLSASGPQQLTIDALCRAMDRTKGSFYHHFDGFGDFKTRLLQHFEERGTLQIIETVEQEERARTKLHRLLNIIVEYSRETDPDPEVAIRAWALHDAEVRTVQERVDAQRLDYLKSLCHQFVPDEQRALRMARLLYAVLVGCEQMHPPLRGDDLRALFDEYLHRYSLLESDA